VTRVNVVSVLASTVKSIPDGRHKMLGYIGRILYWLGSILAAAIILADFVLVVLDDEPHAPHSASILIGSAIAVWLIGRICQRVLSRPPAAQSYSQ